MSGNCGRKPSCVEQSEAHVQKGCFPVDNEWGTAYYLILYDGQEIPVVTCRDGRL